MGARVDRSGQSNDTLPTSKVSIQEASGKDNLAQACVIGGCQDARYFGKYEGAMIWALTDIEHAGPPSTFASMFHNTLRNRRNGSKDPLDREIAVPLNEVRCTAGVHPSLERVFRRRSFQPLPAWEEALALVDDFFRNENKFLPLFDPPKFMAFLGRQYTDDPPGEPAWWCSLNAVLAISTRKQDQRQRSCPMQESLAWAYASNAMDVVLDVTMRNISLQSVQALSALAWFYFGTLNPQQSFMLSAAAMRLSHAIGLHDQDSDLSTRPAERELRNRVFWIAWIMDHQTCFRTGRPLLHNVKDFNIALPSTFGEKSRSVSTDARGAMASQIFDNNIQLSLIEADIHGQLYSNSNVSNTREKTTYSRILDGRLQDWWNALPALCQSESVSGTVANDIQLELLRLHLRYQHCVILIHRVSGLHDYWAPRWDPLPSNISSGLHDTVLKCVSAARSIVQLLDLVPEREESLQW